MPCAPPASDFDALSAEAAAERIARQAAVLRELTELGMALARRVVEEAAEPEAAAGAARVDPALSFSRISRAVRLTLALEKRLFEEAKAVAPPAAAKSAFKLSIGRKDNVAYAVESLLENGDEDYDEEEFDRLLEEADERLADIETEDGFAETPISALVARICADLGLTPDWTVWASEAWAKEEARDGVAGSPYERGRPGKVAGSNAAAPILEAADATGPP